MQARGYNVGIVSRELFAMRRITVISVLLGAAQFILFNRRINRRRPTAPVLQEAQ